ncbi:unnamed protein product [Amoebophrya sp. A120]|nr:unnamed protein product [Amoebophrya sp. A120]|eukprot:GSA120T00007457001.1
MSPAPVPYDLLALGTTKLVVADNSESDTASQPQSFLRFSTKLEWEETGLVSACWLEDEHSHLVVAATSSQLTVLDAKDRSVVTQDAFEDFQFRSLTPYRSEQFLTASDRGLHLWEAVGEVKNHEHGNFGNNLDYLTDIFETTANGGFDLACVSSNQEKTIATSTRRNGKVWLSGSSSSATSSSRDPTGATFAGGGFFLEPYGVAAGPSQGTTASTPVVDTLTFAQKKDLLAVAWQNCSGKMLGQSSQPSSASTSSTRTAVFDVTTGKCVYETSNDHLQTSTINPKSNYINRNNNSNNKSTFLSFSPHHSDLLISAHANGVIQFTDIKVGSSSTQSSSNSKSEIIKSLNTKQKLTSLSYCNDGIRLALGTEDKGLLLFDLRKASDPVFPKVLMEEPVRFVKWSGSFNFGAGKSRNEAASTSQRAPAPARDEQDASIAGNSPNHRERNYYARGGQHQQPRQQDSDSTAAVVPNSNNRTTNASRPVIAEVAATAARPQQQFYQHHPPPRTNNFIRDQVLSEAFASRGEQHKQYQQQHANETADFPEIDETFPEYEPPNRQDFLDDDNPLQQNFDEDSNFAGGRSTNHLFHSNFHSVKSDASSRPGPPPFIGGAGAVGSGSSSSSSTGAAAGHHLNVSAPISWTSASRKNSGGAGNIAVGSSSGGGGTQQSTSGAGATGINASSSTVNQGAGSNTVNKERTFSGGGRGREHLNDNHNRVLSCSRASPNSSKVNIPPGNANAASSSSGSSSGGGAMSISQERLEQAFAAQLQKMEERFEERLTRQQRHFDEQLQRLGFDIARQFHELECGVLSRT